MKILYLYDFDDWAIHNVGKLWFDGLSDVETTYMNVKDISSTCYNNYDIIWYGFTGVFYKKEPAMYRIPMVTGFLDRIPPLKNVLHLKKSVIAIHDPSELFPLVDKWKSCSYGRMHRLIFRYTAAIVVLSEEMENVLSKNGQKVHKIPTMSSISPVPENKIRTEKCSAYAAYNNHKRKNASLLEKLQFYCINTLEMKFDCKTGMKILSEDEYIKELDSHEIYVCTSLQEGGPLPAMDAMARGAIVVTTPVGQLPEIIKNGENGFFCKNEEEFKQTLKYLWECDKDQLHTYRLSSLRSIQEKRQRFDIQKKVQDLLSQLS